MLNIQVPWKFGSPKISVLSKHSSVSHPTIIYGTLCLAHQLEFYASLCYRKTSVPLVDWDGMCEDKKHQKNTPKRKRFCNICNVGRDYATMLHESSTSGAHWIQLKSKSDIFLSCSVIVRLNVTVTIGSHIYRAARFRVVSKLSHSTIFPSH